MLDGQKTTVANSAEYGIVKIGLKITFATSVEFVTVNTMTTNNNMQSFIMIMQHYKIKRSFKSTISD